MEGLGLRGLFQGAYADRRVLVTGHTGFKGSWLVFWLRAMGSRVSGLSLDPDTEPSHWNLLGVDGVADHRIDLSNESEVCRVIQLAQPEIVFHLAAQPLVRRSYREPVRTFRDNIMGLVNLLEAVRATPSICAIVNATTDKVYRDQAGNAGYIETDPLGGHDPYSTSKACAELVSDCYAKSFFGVAGTQTLLATARAGNVVGGGDWAEDRLVPDLVRAAANSAPLLVRNPHAIRPWQHVLEPLSGYLVLGQALLSKSIVGGAWNFGPTEASTMCVGALVEAMKREWPELVFAHDPGANLHEAATLRLDCSKAARWLGWRPVWNSDTTVSRTIEWYRCYYDDGTLMTSADLIAYVSDARVAGMDWAA